ncbi:MULTISPECIES: hypothetical protein [Bradyrhizobium]|uniref:Uncharacterized protein n=1 Tax=Bradyrhizobium vignae TaxID=1549949 RepID=A0A2U3Q5I0_9BRAD|nr:hypothetical protein [Bradyrhizobium vignae]MBP0116513.1 hypothetical protein [Bradyrhizobium vignae]RXH03715.1 hypothetical protein EAV90_12900 [Bradyrhizobium vignae]SPP96683.1 protein of unknown function [Bradyrhizobium vignae]
MSGLHHLQTSPAALARADLLKSAKVPAGNPWVDAAAALLRHRFEALASQLAELEALRERVLEAEQKLDPSFT